jgi:hypothetical protein
MVLISLLASVVVITFGAKRTLAGVIVLVIGIGFFSIAQRLNLIAGGTEFAGVSDRIEWSRSHVNEAEYESNSVGQMFAGTSLVRQVVFAPVIMASQLVAPFPNIRFQTNIFMEGLYGPWQQVAMILSGALYMLLLPWAIAGVLESVSNVEGRRGLLFAMPGALILVTIALTIGFHERYRLMATPFVWGAIWFGFGSPRVRKVAKAYYPACALVLVAYFVYKLQG